MKLKLPVITFLLVLSLDVFAVAPPNQSQPPVPNAGAVQPCVNWKARFDAFAAMASSCFDINRVPRIMQQYTTFCVNALGQPVWLPALTVDCI